MAISKTLNEPNFDPKSTLAVDQLWHHLSEDFLSKHSEDNAYERVLIKLMEFAIEHKVDDRYTMEYESVPGNCLHLLNLFAQNCKKHDITIDWLHVLSSLHMLLSNDLPYLDYAEQNKFAERVLCQLGILFPDFDIDHTCGGGGYNILSLVLEARELDINVAETMLQHGVHADPALDSGSIFQRLELEDPRFLVKLTLLVKYGADISAPSTVKGHSYLQNSRVYFDCLKDRISDLVAYIDADECNTVEYQGSSCVSKEVRGRMVSAMHMIGVIENAKIAEKAAEQKTERRNKALGRGI